MDERLTVGIFPTNSAQGKDLLDQISALANSWDIEIEPFPQANGVQVLWQCRNKDIIIFDASIEAEGQHNYAAVTGELMILDHLLVVSRTYLPLNLLGSRPGGWPDYPHSFSNQQIIDWLANQIADIKRGVQGGKRPRDLIGLKTWKKSWDQQQHRLNARGQIFISYRSPDAEAVKALKQRIENGDFHQGEKKQVLYFPPGLLSSELMTEQRRWQIVSIIRDYLIAADEIWIYETKSVYYNSWWTLAELLTLSYMRSHRKVSLYDPNTQSVHRVANDYLQQLTKEQRNRAARWFANCTPDEMGPESIAAFRMMREIPIINKLRFIKDHVWSEEFWHHPVLDCPQCRTIGHAQNRYVVDDLLFTRGTNFTRFTPDEIQDCLRTGQITCGNAACQAEYQMSESPAHYLWIPPGRAHLVAQFTEQTWTAMDHFLVSMPTYLIK